MKAVLKWLDENHGQLVSQLADLVSVRSISTDGEHQKEIEQTAQLTCAQMRQAGLQEVQVLRSGESNPYAYGEWLCPPGQADSLPLRPPRCTACQLCRAVAIEPLETGGPFRATLWPRGC